MRSGYQTLPYHADGAAFVQQSRRKRSSTQLAENAGPRKDEYLSSNHKSYLM